jgi:hypothetical protein
MRRRIARDRVEGAEPAQALALGPIRASVRSRISRAALLVKVTASICPRPGLPVGRMCASAGGQHARLAGAGAGQHQQRAFGGGMSCRTIREQSCAGQPVILIAFPPSPLRKTTKRSQRRNPSRRRALSIGEILFSERTDMKTIYSLGAALLLGASAMVQAQDMGGSSPMTPPASDVPAPPAPATDMPGNSGSRNGCPGLFHVRPDPSRTGPRHVRPLRQAPIWRPRLRQPLRRRLSQRRMIIRCCSKSVTDHCMNPGEAPKRLCQEASRQVRFRRSGWAQQMQTRPAYIAHGFDFEAGDAHVFGAAGFDADPAMRADPAEAVQLVQRHRARAAVIRADPSGSRRAGSPPGPSASTDAARISGRARPSFSALIRKAASAALSCSTNRQEAAPTGERFQPQRARPGEKNLPRRVPRNRRDGTVAWKTAPRACGQRLGG